MNIKKLFALIIIVIAVFCCINVASAGLFDLLSGGNELKSETYEFPNFTVEFAEKAVVTNETYEIDGVNRTVYNITWEPDCMFHIIVDDISNSSLSLDEYVDSLTENGAKYEGDYRGWKIVNLNGYTYYNQRYTYDDYLLIKYDGPISIMLESTDLDFLKGVADSYKKR
jgi:hypothetical protein